MIETLAQVTGNDRKGRPFCAGVILFDDVVVEASPILRRALARRTRDQVREICKRNGWHIVVVHELHRAREPRPDEV